MWQLFLTRARAGCHKVRWTLAHARPRGALAPREIEPKLQSSCVSRSAPHFSDNKKGLPIRKSFLLSKRARAGCHKVQWTLALARPRSALALREIEPKLQSSCVSRSAPHFSDNKKRTFHLEVLFINKSASRVPEPRSSGPWLWHDRGAL